MKRAIRNISLFLKVVLGVNCLLLMSKSATAQQADTLFYATGALKGWGMLEEGKRSGTWTFLYPNGTLNAVEHYQNGALEGEVLRYDFDGNLIARENYRQDLQQDSSFYYHGNGKLKSKGSFESGLYEGIWRFWDEQGALVRVGQYNEGLPVNLWSFYHNNGTLWQQGNFLAGKEEGEWRYYREDGSLEYSGIWQQGIKVAPWYYHTPRGKKKKIKPEN